MVFPDGSPAYGHVIMRTDWDIGILGRGKDAPVDYVIKETNSYGDTGDIIKKWSVSRTGEGSYRIKFTPYFQGEPQTKMIVDSPESYTKEEAERKCHDNAVLELGLMDFGPWEDLTERAAA